MLSLIYVSNAREGLGEADVAAIAKKAAANNAHNEITGLLAYNSQSFMQLLEGTSNAVLAVMRWIERDERHDNIVYIRQQHRDERECPNWSMRSLITPLRGIGSANVFTGSLPREMELDTKILFTSFASSLSAQQAIHHSESEHVFQSTKCAPDND